MAPSVAESHQACTTRTVPPGPAVSAAKSSASCEEWEKSTPTTTLAGLTWSCLRSGCTSTTGHWAWLAVLNAVVPIAA